MSHMSFHQMLPQQNQSNMQIPTQISSHIRARSPERHNPNQPPFKRRKRRTWCDVVESRALANGIEHDSHRVSQRQKQIDYGKNTIAYDRFNALCPRQSRIRGDPMTPLARQKCSKRSFAGQITSWKKQVYAYVAKLDQQQKANKFDQNQHQEHLEESTPQHPEESTPQHNGEEDNFSDMNDVELDDFGNLVGAPPSRSPQDDQDAPAENADESPASIFDSF